MKIYLNEELSKINGLTKITDSKGRCYPELTENNIKLVDSYVMNHSSYAAKNSDDYVKKYFQFTKKNENEKLSLAEIIIRIILIDTVDSTNLKSHLGKDYYVRLAEKILKCNLEEYIKDGKKIGEIFKEIASFPPKEGMKKEDLNLFIFLSKYITRTNQYCYDRDDYSIMDRVVKKYLPLYAGNDAKKQLDKFRQDYDYDGYCKFIGKLLKEVPGIKRNQIDHFIWFSFKEPAVGDR